MLRKLLLSTTAFAVLSGAALAADLPSRTAPPVYTPPIPIFTWTGVYIGGDIGYAWGESNYISSIGFRPSTAWGSTNPDGVIGGAHVGYNFQAGPSFIGTGNFVVGVEGDVSGSNYSKTFLSTFGDSYTTKMDVAGSIRGRLGIAFDRALIYATGGVAFGGFTSQLRLQNGTGSWSNDKTAVGWTVGGGIEYAVTNNWSVRAEYRYTDYGHIDSYYGNANYNKHDTQNSVRVGFSYKFDTFAPLAPVVAKY